MDEVQRVVTPTTTNQFLRRIRHLPYGLWHIFPPVRPGAAFRGRRAALDRGPAAAGPRPVSPTEPPLRCGPRTDLPVGFVPNTCRAGAWLPRRSVCRVLRA